MKSLKKLLLTLSLLAAALPLLNAEVVYPSEKQPDVAVANGTTLENKIVSAKFSTNKGFSVKFDGKKVAAADELFEITLGNGERVPASKMTCAGGLKKVALKGDPKALKLSERLPGQALEGKFTKGDLVVEWRAVLRDGSHYVRQELKISAKKDTPMTAIVPLALTMKGAKVLGNTRGSPVVTETAFAALETPMGRNEVSGDKMTGTWSRKTTLKKGDAWEVSAVVGSLVPGQERRSFLAYNERERVMPWRPFVHYNSWYELNIDRNNVIDKRMKEADCLAVVAAWEKNLFKKHKVGIEAFVWDDGWDDFNSLWGFYKPAFPDGFKKIDAAARKQGAGTGAWLGPVGGYGSSKAQRLGFWNKNHPNNQIGNFQLSNKEYFDAFVGQCSKMIEDYDMRYFKFDGISAIPVAYGPANEEDAEGIISVERALRKKRGDLFINTTVGTWASPFWFHIADSVWRQAGDHGQQGSVGDSREKWITYRDDWVHKIFVTGSPLCPINSLMTHGLMVTKFGPPRSMPRNKEGKDGILKEMRCAFACGSALQELYVDNDLMTELDLWGDLAECIKWYRGNADVFDDVHWVGGDPWDEKANAGSVYGWAAWNKSKATLALRNSSKEEKTFTTTLRKALDVPAFVQGSIRLTPAFKSGQRSLQGITGATIPLDKEITFKLKPFEVFVFDGKPGK